MKLEGERNAKRAANDLRKHLTPPEARLWTALRRDGVGLRFRKQHAAGPYVLDFYCAPARLAVEVDGEAHNRGDGPARDAARDAWLMSQGVAVLRFSTADVMKELDAVVRRIAAVAAERSTPNDGHR